jgi:hypothetical protein
MIKSETMGISGGDLLKKPPDMNPSAHKDVLVKSKSGGGLGRTRPPEQAPEPEEDLIAEPVAEPIKKQPEVRLSNPKWSAESAFFEDKVMASVDVELPETHKDLTRITLTLFSLLPNGKKEQISTLDVHAKSGKAEGEFIVQRPADRDGKKVASSSYAFTAKHRDSKDIESGQLKATEVKPNLILELDEHSDIAKPGFSVVLKSKDGSVHSKFLAKDGVKKGSLLSFDFKKLDSETAYVMELRDDKDKAVDVIFKDKKPVDWKVEPEAPDSN